MDQLTSQLTNQGGFLLDAQGIVRGLELPISPDPVSGLPRRAYHDSLTTGRNLQMVHRVGVVTYTADGETTVLKEIEASVTDTRQLNAQLEKWQDQSFPFSTENSVVNPQTGAVVAAGTEGAMEQLGWLQSLTAAHLQAMGMPVTAQTSILHIEYLMNLLQIQQYDQQGRL